MAAKVVAFGFSFVLPLLIVRVLTQEAVGHYREAFQVITNAVIILPLGFSMSAYYFLARETDERRAAAILNILIFNFVVGGLACLTLFLFPQIIGNVFQSEEMTAAGTHDRRRHLDLDICDVFGNGCHRKSGSSCRDRVYHLWPN